MGWPGERQRHAMSSRGIQTSRLDTSLLAKGVKMHGIEKFWVVTKPGTHSVPADVLFDSDISYLLNQIRGGLNESEILGIYADPDEAREATLDALYFHQIEDTSWELFVKQWGISYMELEEFANRMGYKGVGDLTVSLSPEVLYKKDELRFVEEFADFGEPSAIEAERSKEPYQAALQREIEAHFSSRGVSKPEKLDSNTYDNQKIYRQGVQGPPKRGTPITQTFELVRGNLTFGTKTITVTSKTDLQNKIREWKRSLGKVRDTWTIPLVPEGDWPYWKGD